MNQETLKRLQGSPDFQELKDFLGLKLLELDSLRNMPNLPNAVEYSLEGKARSLAVDKLSDILEGLVELPERFGGASNKDFVA